MAGQDVGTLNFGVDGEDKPLKDKLERLTKEAVKLESILKNIKVGTSASSLSKEVQKAQSDTDKLAVSTSKVAKAEEDLNNARRKGALLQEQKNNAAKQGLSLEEKTANEKRKGVVLDNQGRQSAEAAGLATQKRINAEIDAINKKAQAQQAEILNAAKLEGIQKRNALIGAKSVSDVNNELSKQESIVGSLTKRAAAYFSVYKVAQFAKEIVTVRGEFEGLDAAFETMLGSADKSRQMMSEITNMALQTPYTVMDVADNVKQLIAMGIEAKNAMGTMKALGDVAAGVSVPLWRIAINYGQVATLGKLQQREIRDFAMAGVPIMDALADVMGKTKAEITGMVTAGQVGFPQVEEAFKRMAGEGGKFQDMMQKRNATMLGQLNRLQDQVQLMMNEIGKSNEGFIYSVIGGLSSLVENYKTVGEVVLALAATYGVYRAAVIANNIAIRIQTEMAIQAALANTALTTSQNVAAVAATNWSRAMKALNGSMLTNPYLLAAAAIVGLAYTMYKLATAASAAEYAQAALNNEVAATAKYAEDERTSVEKLLSVIKDEVSTRRAKLQALDTLKTKYPSIFSSLDIEKVKNLDLADALRQVNLELERRSGIQSNSNINRAKEILSGISEFDGIVFKYRKDIFDAKDILGLDGIWERNSVTNAQLKERLEEYVKQAEKLKLDKVIQDKRAEYEAMPSSDKIKVLNKDISTLELEFERIKKIDEGQKKFNTGFSIYGGQLEAIESQINAKRKEIRLLETSTTTSENKNKEFWETQKKNATSALEGMTEAQKGSVEWLKQLQLLNEAESKLKVWDFSGKQSREKKDPEIEKLENRIDLLKRAKTEYDKLSKVMDSNDAYAEISANIAFKGVKQSDISNEGYIKTIESIIDEVSKKKNSPDRDKLLANLLTLKSETIAQIAKDAADAIERELSKYKDKYNLYETLLGITGNEDQAKSLAFGNADQVIQSYRDKLKAAIDATEDKELKKKLEDQLFSFDNTETESFLKDMAKLLKKYQSYEDQISQLKKDGINERQKITDRVSSGEIDSQTGERLLEASFNKQKDLLRELENESFKLTTFYQRLFGDINNYGIKTLSILLNKTKDIISQAKTAQKDSSGRYEIEIDGKKTPVSEKDLADLVKRSGVLENKISQANPFKALANSFKEYKDVMNNPDSTEEDKAAALDALSSKAIAVGAVIKDLSSDFAEMFDALGSESLGETIGFIGELAGAATQVGTGIASGNPVQVIQGIVGGITSIAKHHDKKLDKAIKRSQLEVKKLQNSYADLSRFISRQLGAVTETQTKQQIANLKKQQAELRSQISAERDKKKSDGGAILDYQNAINELGDQIKYFYEDLLDEQYGLNLKGIADQLSSSLVDAFKKGEDAAESFDKTVADIINNLATKMISLQVIEPAMQGIRDYLFGSNGVFNDGELSVNDAKGLVGQMAGLKESIGKGKTIWDALNEAAKQAGIDLSEVSGSTKETLSKGIEGIKEDQADLLASYINAIRADVSITKDQIIAMAEISRLNNTTLGDMLLVLKAIEVNTLNTADNTKNISESVKSTNDILRAATTIGSPTKINIQ